MQHVSQRRRSRTWSRAVIAAGLRPLRPHELTHIGVAPLISAQRAARSAEAPPRTPPATAGRRLLADSGLRSSLLSVSPEVLRPVRRRTAPTRQSMCPPTSSFPPLARRRLALLASSSTARRPARWQRSRSAGRAALASPAPRSRKHRFSELARRGEPPRPFDKGRQQPGDVPSQLGASWVCRPTSMQRLDGRETGAEDLGSYQG